MLAYPGVGCISGVVVGSGAAGNHRPERVVGCGGLECAGGMEIWQRQHLLVGGHRFAGAKGEQNVAGKLEVFLNNSVAAVEKKGRRCLRFGEGLWVSDFAFATK